MAAPSASRTLEIVVKSAENLRICGKPIRSNAFVVVKADSRNFLSTETNEDGGSFPSWNEKLTLDLPTHATFMTVEVHCRTSGKKIRTAGTAKVPVSDFSSGFVPECFRQSLSYRLRDDRGERNGIINISVRVKVAGNRCSLSPKQEPGVLAPEKRIGGDEVVVGIPVWHCYNHPAKV